MTGMILDSLLLLLLVVALGYGVRLESRLRTLREGQVAFAGAVTELNSAAGRAEQALASLRAASQETDLLHDRIVKAREARQALETLLSRTRGVEAVREAAPAAEPTPSSPVLASFEAVLKAREAAAADVRQPDVRGPDVRGPVLQALAAGQAARESLNRARRSLDADFFAARAS